MRRNRRAVGPSGHPSGYSPIETLLVAVAVSLALFALVAAVALPAFAVLAVATVVASWATVVVAWRVGRRRWPAVRTVTLRVPFTDRRLEV